MMLLLHISIALASLAYTTYLYLAPTQQKLRITQILVVATLLSGTYLVVAEPAHMMRSCITGLVYLGVVAAGMAYASRKLAAQHV